LGRKRRKMEWGGTGLKGIFDANKNSNTGMVKVGGGRKALTRTVGIEGQRGKTRRLEHHRLQGGGRIQKGLKWL